METTNHRSRHTIIDYLLYSVAAAVIAVISFSFILWLRY